MDDGVWPGDRIEELIEQRRDGTRGPGWSGELLSAIAELGDPLDPQGRATLDVLGGDLQRGWVPLDRTLTDALAAVAAARARRDDPSIGPVVMPSPGGLDLEVVWIGDEFTIASAGSADAFASVAHDWEQIACVADLVALLFDPWMIWRFVDEDDLKAAGIDPDAFEGDPSVLPADMPLDRGRVFSIAAEKELLPAPPHYGDAAEDLLDLLPASVVQLAHVGGASPMNSENFVTFAPADLRRVVALLLEAGHRVAVPDGP